MSNDNYVIVNLLHLGLSLLFIFYGCCWFTGERGCL